MTTNKFNSFKEFYPFYLSEHKKKETKILHFIGTLGVVILILYCFISKDWNKIFYAPVIGYGFAWTGHLFFEKNRPATFQYPLYSLMGDFVMFWNILTRREKI